MGEVYRFKKNFYIHVLDNNTNVTRCLVGPRTFTRQDHEKVLFSPKPCVAIPPRNYCRIRNPCVRVDGEPVVDEYGSVKLRLGDEEIRFGDDQIDPFPLMPGEILVGDEKDPAIKQLSIVPKNTALKLRCIRDFGEGEALKRAGDEWMFPGPNTYIPRVDVEIAQTVKAHIIRPNTALRLRAKDKFTDRSGAEREVGEEWLVHETGAFLPAVQEEIVGSVDAKVLTEQTAIHVEAARTFTDAFGKKRLAGEQWLITSKDTCAHIAHVYEKVIADVNATVLTNRQFCVVVNPVDPATLRNRFGEQEIRRGDACFFLHPGETLRNNIEDVVVLKDHESLLVRANEAFKKGSETRKPGEKWLITGPAEYVPPVEVTVLERRKALSLDKTEGVYVRDETTGDVRAVIGSTYMLKANETLWSKELPAIVEDLHMRPGGFKHIVKDADVPPVGPKRVKHNVVRFNVQHNAAVQVFDFKTKKERIVFGPDMVMLSPDEKITVLSISGDKPKIPNICQSLQMFLGPDFSSDVVVVETSDHARLQLKLSYNWHFDVDKKDPASVAKIFSVPDFVGDFCKAIASRVRGAVAAEHFDSFHRNSAKIIRAAVFGMEGGKVRDRYKFTANNLVVTNIDIQSIEPIDTKTRDSLQKSVQLAIEITTNSQEAAARHESERKDQIAKGQLERQKLVDKIEAEKERILWLQLKAESEAIQAAGQAVAEAKAQAEAELIEANAELELAQLKAHAFKISAQAEMDRENAKRDVEATLKAAENDTVLTKTRALAEIDASKLSSIMAAIGQDTIVDLARAGPETQAKLLESLGLKGYLITDGNSPINLFNTANGMMGAQAAAATQ